MISYCNYCGSKKLQDIDHGSSSKNMKTCSPKISGGSIGLLVGSIMTEHAEESRYNIQMCNLCKNKIINSNKSFKPMKISIDKRKSIIIPHNLLVIFKILHYIRNDIISKINYINKELSTIYIKWIKYEEINVKRIM